MVDRLKAPWAKQQLADMGNDIKLQECLDLRYQRAKKKGDRLDPGAQCEVCGARYDAQQDQIVSVSNCKRVRR